MLALELLARGRVDYALHHLLFGKIQLEILGVADQIVISEQPLEDFSQTIHFAFSKQSQCKHLSVAFAAKLSKYIETHDMEALLDVHTQTYLDYLKENETENTL